MSKTDREDKCELCGCFMEHVDNSYLGEGGWVDDEWFQCNNLKCRKNKRLSIKDNKTIDTL